MFSVALLLSLGTLRCLGGELPADHVAGKLIQLNDNGAWSWFMDPRAIVFEGKIVVGSVRAIGNFARGKSDPDWGNVEISVLDIASGKTGKTILDRHFEQDDHNGPAFLPMGDGRLLAMYTRHGVEHKIFYRFSKQHDPLSWSEAKVFESPGSDSPAFRGSNVTYSNPFRLPGGRIYNFYRGVGFDPNYMYSDDEAQTWHYGGHLLRGRGGYSPYLKYAYDGHGTLYFIATDDHPRNYDNSLYGGYFRDGKIYFSDGKLLGNASTDTTVEYHPWDLTPIFKGDFENVAWCNDIKLDPQKHPYITFSVHKGGRLAPRHGGMDHRYFYGRFDGTTWHVHEMAYAGMRLYPGEDDYTGLAMLDPRNPDVVYISTNAEPTNGEPLISSSDQQRHYELFRGRTSDQGQTWKWEPITTNSSTDNLRPLVPQWDDPRTALIWMRRKYSSNRGQWSTAVVATILPAADK